MAIEIASGIKSILESLSGLSNFHPNQSQPNYGITSSYSSLGPQSATEEDFASLARQAHFDDSDNTKQWMATITKYMKKAGNRMNPLEAAFRSVVQAMREYNIMYQAAHGVRLFYKGLVTINLLTPNGVLKTRLNDCRDSSLLVAATLSRLGYEMVLAINDGHVLPVVIMSTPRNGKLAGSPIIVDGKKRYLYSIEVNFHSKKDATYESSIRRGALGLKHTLRQNWLKIVTLEGKIILQKEYSK